MSGNKKVIDASDDGATFGRNSVPALFASVEKTASARRSDFAVSFYNESGERIDRLPLATPTQALQSAVYASEFSGNIPVQYREDAMSKLASALADHGMPEYAEMFSEMRGSIEKVAATAVDVDTLVAEFTGRQINEQEKLAEFVAGGLTIIEQRALVKQAAALGSEVPGLDNAALRGDIIDVNNADHNVDSRISLVQANPAAVSSYTIFKMKLAMVGSGADSLISELYELDKKNGLTHLYGSLVVDPVRSLVVEKIKTAERAVFVGNRGIGESQLSANKEKIAARFGSGIATELASNLDAFDSLPHVMKNEIADICLG